MIQRFKKNTFFINLGLNLYISTFLLLTTIGSLNAQTEDKLVQFSGVVVSSDSLSSIPFVSVIIKNSNHGTISDYYGYFSFVTQAGDTVRFSSIGYKTAEYVVPDTLSSFRYSLIQVLEPDTIELREAVVYPWPSVEDFKRAFLNLQINDDDLELARRNLEDQKMRDIAEGMPMGASMNFKNQMDIYNSRLYYAGQAPAVNLLNPLAWSRFIDAWKKGEFKQNR